MLTSENKELKEALAEAQEQIRRLESAKDENRWLDGAIKKRTGQLNERVKELEVLYFLADLLAKPQADLDDVCRRLANRLPEAMQYPNLTSVRLKISGKTYQSTGFSESRWALKEAGVEIFYSQDKPFLEEERKLLHILSVWLRPLFMIKSIRE